MKSFGGLRLYEDPKSMCQPLRVMPCGQMVSSSACSATAATKNGPLVHLIQHILLIERVPAIWIRLRSIPHIKRLHVFARLCFWPYYSGIWMCQNDAVRIDGQLVCLLHNGCDE